MSDHFGALCIKGLKNQNNSLHERALRLVYNDFKSSFHQLLEKDNSVTIHQRNLQILAVEIFKVHNNITPEIIKDVFELKNHQYNFRRDLRLQRRNVRSSHQRCSVKKMFLENSQNSQKNTCARVSFLKGLQASGLQLY